MSGLDQPRNAPTPPGRERSPRLGTLIPLLAVAVLIRGAVLLQAPHALADDPDAYRRLAENLVEHGTFGHGTVPTAYRPPLYPLLLAPAVAADESVRVAIGVLHLALGVATVCLVYVLGVRWGLGKLATVAAALVACDPILLGQSALVMTETLATFLAVIGLWLLTAAGERPSAPRAATAGAWLALASLCRPTFLVFLAAAAVVLPGFADRWSRRLTMFGAFALAASVVLAPWVVRNQVQLGRPVVATTHGGYTLLLGNNPWFYDYLRSGRWGSVWNADRFTADWSSRLARGGPRDEPANDRVAYAEAWRTIRQQPGTFAYASAVRVGRLWAPVPHQTDAGEGLARRILRYGVGGWYLVEFALAALAGFRVQGSGFRILLSPFSRRRPRRRPVAAPSHGFSLPSTPTGPSAAGGSTAWLWGALLVVCFTAVHTLYWANMRMRAPLMPVVALGAAAGAGWIGGRIVRRKSC